VKHEDRRKEAGKMFIDISKYIITVGVIGNIAYGNLSSTVTLFIFMIAVISFVLGICTIPPKRG